MVFIALLPSVREEPLMIWGGGSGKSGKKNSTATRAEKKTQLNNPEKKTQLNNLEEKTTASCRGNKSSTANCRGKKKFNS